MKEIAIIMGSSSDLTIMNEAVEVIKTFGLEPHVEVVSAHRTPEKMVEFGKAARANGFKVIIAGAGGAAHLPGMVASLTSLPIIGVPISLIYLLHSPPWYIPYIRVFLDSKPHFMLFGCVEERTI